MVAPEPAADVPARMARAVADPGTALVLDLAEVGMIGLSDVRAPHVVVTAPEPWRAAAAAELLQARGQSADWWEPGMEPT